ncbi:F0F1 ATP synthase subunit delta [Campylobacter helveticus]|uniref:F0F1 ATP synthase subunit delta n=1 Tax=Campylobacter helveticus TaxID=28898 RepID=UPI0022EA603E|nr:F0F1 ATP synthase subunit delta [Campylobacter helveticus]
MMDMVAKKYAKAIALRADAEEFYENLRLLTSAFTLSKFRIIVESAEVKKERKLELIQSFFEKLSPSFNNFLRILVENSRLSFVPQIVEELERQNAFKENIFLGVVYVSEKLDDESLRELEARLSAKFNVKVKLRMQIAQIDGVKIALEELGYELSFSMKTLQNKLSEFILKTI